MLSFWLSSTGDHDTQVRHVPSVTLLLCDGSKTRQLEVQDLEPGLHLSLEGMLLTNLKCPQKTKALYSISSLGR